MICYGDIDDSNLIAYKSHKEDTKWYCSGYCSYCINHLIETQWKTFDDMVCKETCKAAVLRLISDVPLYIKDKHALPCHTHKDDDNTPKGCQVEYIFIKSEI